MGAAEWTVGVQCEQYYFFDERCDYYIDACWSGVDCWYCVWWEEGGQEGAGGGGYAGRWEH